MAEQVTIDKETFHLLRDGAWEHYSNLGWWLGNYTPEEIEFWTHCSIGSDNTKEELEDYYEKLGSALERT